jgi:hypothetical protein
MQSEQAAIHCMRLPQTGAGTDVERVDAAATEELNEYASADSAEKTAHRLGSDHRAIREPA